MKPIFIALQFLLPQHLLSRLIGQLAASKTPLIKNTLINMFASFYNIDFDEAEHPFAEEYESFNAFFTRQLKPGCREICAAPEIASPADGAISEIGSIHAGQIMQAKSQCYTSTTLLGSADDAKLFDEGKFATVYLSPRDYHRVHMPLSGRLLKTRYIPGALFSVNQTTADNVENLFARNERLVCIFETDHGPMAVVLVGAMIVAGISTVWQDHYPAKPFTTIEALFEGEEAPCLKQGDELGRFYLGSTSIVLLPNNGADWHSHLENGSNVQMGQSLGQLPN